ncbi:uncharacterized protein LOC122503246 [Leptopilina heterotoma]|nr:uncharacterized protein LOC122503246 [Leptopilina heterotoma]
MCPKLRHFVVLSSCIHIKERIDDILLREIDLTKIFQQKSKEIKGLLIFLGPVCGITESTNEKNVPILTNSIIIDQIDTLIRSNASIVAMSYKPLAIEQKKLEKNNIASEESERSKFENYIKGSVSSF